MNRDLGSDTRWLARAAKAFEDQTFRDAVAAPGRRRLVFGALQTEVRLTFAVIEALKAGHEAQFVTDAVGDRSEIVTSR